MLVTRRLAALTVAATAAVLTLGAGPAAASHPCEVEQPCESHWCLGPNLKPPFLFYPC